MSDLIDLLGPPKPKPRDLTHEEAELLQAYKALLNRLELSEALQCGFCFEKGVDANVRAAVTDTRIVLDCTCTTRHYTATK